MRMKKMEGYLLVMPLLFVVGGLITYPLLKGLMVSFQDKVIGFPMVHFVGIRNYLDFINNPFFWSAVRRSFIYTGVSTVGKLVLGMAMALALNEAFKGRNAIRGLLLIPWVIPSFVTAHTWRWVYDGTGGLLNNVLVSLGLIEEVIPWLGKSEIALFAVTVTGIWRGFPFFGLMLLGGLQVIPRELYEVAEVDGASTLQKFLYITLPGVKVITFLVVVMSAIWTFNSFPLIWIMTNGGPAGATEVLPIFAYKIAFMSMSLSRGTTAFILMFPFTIGMFLILSRVLSSRLK